MLSCHETELLIFQLDLRQQLNAGHTGVTCSNKVMVLMEVSGQQECSWVQTVLMSTSQALQQQPSTGDQLAKTRKAPPRS